MSRTTVSSDIPALVSIDCHQCNQHVAVPVTITARSGIHSSDGLDQVAFTVETTEVHERLIRHMEHG